MCIIILMYLLTGLTVGEEALRNGANDIIVVHRSKGGFVSTRWDVKFGKLHSLLISREGKEVYIFVNNVPARQRMEIQDSGYAAFKGSSDKYMTSHHLEELNLKPGLNKGKFVAPQLGVIIPFNVFLYEENDKIVLTDIDGTITQSDIKGHVMPHFGLTAEHPAVVELFSRIKEQGYHVIYLTSRSFSQDAETKEYLFEMLQNLNGFSLPLGPVLFSANSFLTSLHSEVVLQNPDQQKTKTILDVWRAFNTESKTNIMETVVSAYGNKDSDEKAYFNSGISLDNIYIVDTDGHLVNIGTGEISSYAEQSSRIQTIYPTV